MEEGFAVGHGDLEVGLVEGWWDVAFRFGGDLGHEGWGFGVVGCTGHGL